MPPEIQQLTDEQKARVAARMQYDIAQCAEDPWYAVKKQWVLTEDEHAHAKGLPSVRPLPDRECLEMLAQLWRDNPMILICKSRQLMVSWLMAWLLLWDAIFHDGQHCFFQGKRQEDVSAIGTKGLLGRARFIRDHLPSFLRPIVKAEGQTHEAYKNGSAIEAIPEGQNIIRSKVISSLAMDEIGFHETAQLNWDAAIPAAQGGGHIAGVTTPNGHDFVYNQADMDKPWDDWHDWPQLMEGLHAYKTKKGVMLVALHYTAVPEFRSTQYQDEIRKGYSDVRAYLRERELDFSLPEGLPVYGNEFDRNLHVIDKYVPDPYAPIFRGWDTSYNGQAVGWFQFNNHGQLVWFDQVFRKAVPLPSVCKEVQNRQIKYTSVAMSIGLGGNLTRPAAPQYDYGDPAAEQNNSKGEKDIDTLNQFGFKLITKRTTGRKKDLVDGIRNLLLPRNDGRPGLLLAKNSEEMNFVIAAFIGGYRYPKAKDGRDSKTTPLKDGTYDHIMDQAQYAVDNINFAIYGGEHLADGYETDWWKDHEPGVGSDAFFRQV